MKIGIITFHWATNYGAVLQAYCLQEFLINQGHFVDIINYKPKKYDSSYLRLIVNPRNWLNFRSSIVRMKKERVLDKFRAEKLHITKRYYSCEELNLLQFQYDIVISGSDQVLNPAYTLYGENKPTSSYFLEFCNSSTTIRIGYAVSFGCERYPDDSAKYAQTWINNFDAISVREQTGKKILEQLLYSKKTTVVPDPTLLIGADLFKSLGIILPVTNKREPCVYTIRHSFQLQSAHSVINENSNPPSVENWIKTIATSSCLITDSYHGMIVAILSHVPFAILTEESLLRGMNDRFSTLLKVLGLEDRIVTKSKSVSAILNQPIIWDRVDANLCKYKSVGVEFLTRYI